MHGAGHGQRAHLASHLGILDPPIERPQRHLVESEGLNDLVAGPHLLLRALPFAAETIESTQDGMQLLEIGGVDALELLDEALLVDLATLQCGRDGTRGDGDGMSVQDGVDEGVGFIDDDDLAVWQSARTLISAAKQTHSLSDTPRDSRAVLDSSIWYGRATSCHTLQLEVTRRRW